MHLYAPKKCLWQMEHPSKELKKKNTAHVRSKKEQCLESTAHCPSCDPASKERDKGKKREGATLSLRITKSLLYWP